MGNVINWFEVPASDFERACAFYEAILSQKLFKSEVRGCMMGFFDMGSGGVGGSVICGEGYVPSTEGSVVYLNVEGQMDEVLARVPAAGGTVIEGKSSIGENGFIAYVRDTEGNRIGLHSMVS